MDERVFQMLLAIPAIVAGLTVHEFAHAWMGHRLGDDTARRLGRLTLDPLKHLDPMGSIMFVLGALSGFFFGWAKPVPFDPRNLKNPRRDSIWIAIAGPISNILQVPVWLLLLWITWKIGNATGLFNPLDIGFGDEALSSPAGILMRVIQLGVIINLSLAAFNMIPLPPLDGHYVLEGLGPPFVEDFFNMIRPYSFIILIVLINLPPEYNLIRQVTGPIQGLGFSLVFWTMGFGWVPMGR